MEKGASLYGLTVCCSASGGIIGLGAHLRRHSGDSDQSSYSIWQGRSNGCNLHIRLKPNERIAAIWVLSCKASFFEYPYLGVSDLEGRYSD